jgi:hypothetical protein
MSTQRSKLAAIDDDGHPASGQRLATEPRADDEFSEIEPESKGFSGTCENTSLSDWIQLVQMNRRDAVIGIKRHDGRKALLWCREGDIIDAWCDGIIGEEAVYRALGWDGGRVSVAFGSFERARRIEMTTAALLLHAAHRRDSGVRQRAVRVSPVAFVTLDEPPPSSRHAMPPPPSTLPPPPDSSRMPPSSPLPLIGPQPMNSGQAHARATTSPGLARLPLVTPPTQGHSQPGRGSSGASEPGNSSAFQTLTSGPVPKDLPPPRLPTPERARAATKSTVKDPAMKDAFRKSEALPAPTKKAITLALDRIRERPWLVALVLGLSPLVALGGGWLVTAKVHDGAAAPRTLTTHAEPSRPAMLSASPSENTPPIAAASAPAVDRPAPEPARETPALLPARRAPISWPAKVAPTVSSPLPSKAPARIKATAPALEEHAPRVQIIEERSAKIEVIE